MIKNKLRKNCFNLKVILSIRIARFIAIVVFPAVIVSPVALADEAAIDLLNRMNQSVHKLSYSGTLAYLKDNTLSSLHIDHNIINGVESERVVRLNKAGNEVSRELQDFSFSSIPMISSQMEKVYSFDMGRENRIANIPCRIITARPKDKSRYLQKYCIDVKTGMLLDYKLVNKSHKPVEQFMFTSITIKTSDEQQANKSLGGVMTASLSADPSIVQHENPVAVSGELNSPPSEAYPVSLDDGWVMETLPVGFKISTAPMKKSSLKSGDNALNKTKHYIVSDGLSSLSIFIAPLTDDTNFGAVKINSGALNVVSQQNNDAVITIVGEVPEETLRNIINKLKKK